MARASPAFGSAGGGPPWPPRKPKLNSPLTTSSIRDSSSARIAVRWAAVSRPAATFVEVGLRRGDESVGEPGRGLAFGLGDLGECVAVLEARAELRLGDAEVAGRRREVDEAVVAAAMVAHAGTDADERHLTRLDPLLELGALSRRDRARLHGRVDAVFERLLQRGVELVGADAELLRGVGDDRIALLGR